MKKIFALVLAAVMMFSLSACGKISTEKAVKNYFDLWMEPSAALVEDCFPQTILARIEAKYDMDAADILQKCEKSAEDTKTELEFRYGAGCKTTYEILGVKEPDKDDYDDIMEDLTEAGLKAEDVEEIAEAEVKITSKGDESEDTFTNTFELFKVGGSWYVLDIIEIIPALD